MAGEPLGKEIWSRLQIPIIEIWRRDRLRPRFEIVKQDLVTKKKTVRIEIMFKKIEHGFKIYQGRSGIDSFLFDSNRAGECIDFILLKGYKSILLDQYHGFTADSLDNLLPLQSFVEELIIGSEQVNYDKLSLFSNLTLLSVPDNGVNIVDLSCFPKLHTLNCSVNKRLIGLESCKYLKKITICDYKPKDKNLSEFNDIPSLETLEIINTNIGTLQGIEHFVNLKSFEIFSASKLETIASLQLLSNSLSELIIEKCKKISDYEIIKNIVHLQKLALVDSGIIKSLDFVKFLPELTYICFVETNVLDGNISYCEGINFVGFDNKKHYNHKVKEFIK